MVVLRLLDLGGQKEEREGCGPLGVHCMLTDCCGLRWGLREG